MAPAGYRVLNWNLSAKTGTMDTQLQIEGVIARADNKELILFRIVQETFNNIINMRSKKALKW